ncbi:hypothetical protein LCGC14_1800280 [marine sediment metagenome]|uniref:6-hydroxymethylpterin diphosphokinase MptE-like domain-containing protein n=1 Tax=marine sediment metagenome TaxID=412755 RepID=A0A0F9GPZ7_9ZZZZ
MNEQTATVNIDDAARLKATKFNEATSNRHMANEVRFSFYNHANILKAFKDGRAKDLKDAPKVKDKPILIIGSGATLDEAWPLIQKWEGAIMTSSSQATTAIYYGKEPDYIVSLDPDTGPSEFQVDTWEGRKSVMIIHPGVMPEMFNFWKGPLYLFRKMQPQTPFYANAQKMGYQTLGIKDKGRYANAQVETLITTEIPMLACVIAAQICIAKQLGYNKQFLVGADLSFVDNRDRFIRWDYMNGKWQNTDMGIHKNQGVDPDLMIGNLKSTRMMVFYAHQIVTSWRITQADIINTNNQGLMETFPYCPLEIVVANQGKGIKGYSEQKRCEVSEEYLARQNIYFIGVGEKGIMPHEFQDPISEIPKMLRKLKAALTAQGKGDDLDIDKNMERFNKLFKKVTAKALKPDTPIIKKPIMKIPETAIELVDMKKEWELKQIAWNAIKIMGKKEKREFDIDMIIEAINRHVIDLTFIEMNIVIKKIRQYEKHVERNAA